MTINKRMRVIRPIEITTDKLVSSSVVEDDHPEWNPVTAYTLGQLVIRAATHRIYERLVAGTTATAPEDDADNWLDIGPTNRWAMLDDVVGTATQSTDEISVTVAPGEGVSGLALMELVGRNALVEMRDGPGGAVVYSKAVDLDESAIESVYDWFFNPFIQKTDVVMVDLPFHFPSGEILVQVTSTAGNPVAIGVCKMGEAIAIGGTEYGAKIGIVSYSKKDRDQWGRYSITPRSFSKRATLNVITEGSDFNRIFRSLAALRDTPCIYLATDSAGYEPLIIYGFFIDFSIDVAYATVNYCSLDIEGLV